MKRLVEISRTLSDTVSGLGFAPPVAYVYNPLEYARAPHEAYLHKYARGGATVMVGMNPGPFGMAQTGVPFGDVAMVRDFLEISGAVKKPAREHPKRPVEGFDCPRSEVSGTRLWGWARERFGKPDAFFDRFFVANYCPLVFMGETGRNITPDKLPASEAEALFWACDRALAALVAAMESEVVIGIGAFAKRACDRALADMPVRVGQVLHPSPASPTANRGWAEQAERQLEALGLL